MHIPWYLFLCDCLEWIDIFFFFYIIWEHKFSITGTCTIKKKERQKMNLGTTKSHTLIIYNNSLSFDCFRV